MATNTHVTKSSIPRATHDCDRPGPEKSKSRGPKPHQKYQQNHSSSKPGINDGLLKEDEDAVRRSLLQLEADHTRMKQTLEETIRDAEERLETMNKLMAERERIYAQVCQANMDATADKTKQLEEQVENYEKALIENNIDPVTGEVQELTEEQAAAVEKKKKITKGDVSKMREKLQEMNEDSDRYLIDVQNILKDIEELEATSQRAGGCAAADTLSHTEMADLIKEVEEAQKKEQQEKKKKKKQDCKEDEEKEKEENEEEEEDEKSESPAASSEEKGDSQLRSKSDVFLTQT